MKVRDEGLRSWMSFFFILTSVTFTMMAYLKRSSCLVSRNFSNTVFCRLYLSCCSITFLMSTLSSLAIWYGVLFSLNSSHILTLSSSSFTASAAFSSARNLFSLCAGSSSPSLMASASRSTFLPPSIIAVGPPLLCVLLSVANLPAPGGAMRPVCSMASPVFASASSSSLSSSFAFIFWITAFRLCSSSKARIASGSSDPVTPSSNTNCSSSPSSAACFCLILSLPCVLSTRSMI
mmetsp:Transcript_19807/g.45584  ORF Transcript_19807/g.45584 Transcript_19807/m.45584 type:complete len:235 (-) Transcript_19807:549-1253(-)